jgi:hypothetical protein
MIWDLGYVALWHYGYNLGYKNIFNTYLGYNQQVSMIYPEISV